MNNTEKYLKIIEEYTNDKYITIQELCKQYKCDKSSLYKFIKKNNITIPKKKVVNKEKEEKLKQCIDLYDKYGSIHKISKIIHLTESDISRYLKKYGIIIPYNAPKIKNEFNENFFETIKTEQQAYWFGFLLADGYVTKINRIGLELKLEDKSHIKKFIKVIDGNCKITENNNTARLSIASAKMQNDLIKKGCVFNKSKNGFFNINDFSTQELQRHFIRGYFDGNGHIPKQMTRYELVITIGSEKLAYQFKNLLQNFDIEMSLRNLNTYYRLELYNKCNFIKLLNLMYQGANVYLDRKYETYKLRISPLQ